MDLDARLREARAKLPKLQLDGRTADGRVTEFRRGYLYAIEKLLKHGYESPVETLLDATDAWENFNHT